MAGDHLALRHSTCQRIHRDYLFEHVADENRCFGHETLRQPYPAPKMLWVEEMFLADNHTLSYWAYTLYPQDRGSQRRNRAPARLTDLVLDQTSGLLQRSPLA